MPEVVVPVDWVKQKTLYYCGPAAAQMALKALGVAAPGSSTPWQDALWSQLKLETGVLRPPGAGPGSVNTNPAYPTQLCVKVAGYSDWFCWPTPPRALKRVLNKDQAAAAYFIKAADDEEEATGILMDTLDQKFPGIALVLGWEHWLVVEGYRHDEAGSDVVAGRALNSVYIRDSNANDEIHEIMWDAWRGDYLSSVPYGEYQDKIVVIGAKPAPTTSPSQPSEQTTPAKKKPKVVQKAVYEMRSDEAQQALPQQTQRAAEPGAHLEAIVPPEWAAAASEKAMERLAVSPRWHAALSSRTQRPPLLVQRLDRDDSYYYIVQVGTADTVTARLIVDANTNQFREASGIETTGQALPPFIDPALSVRAWSGEAITMPSLRSRVIRPGTVGTHPMLVWRPCRESRSPFMPFYLRSVGDEFIYLRIDGERFTQLTTGPA